MLLRPPFIQQQDVKSQSSNQISHYQRQPSVKSSSKNKKKENSLGAKKNNIIKAQSNMQIHNNNHFSNQQPNYDSDNQSVHSVNSRKSKGKAKQSTLAIGRNKQTNLNYNNQQNQNSMYSISKQNQKSYEIFKLDSDQDDNKSIGSHASKNSRKNKVKQNSLRRNNTKNNAINKGNIQVGYYFNNNPNNNNPKSTNNSRQPNKSPDDKYYAEEYSKVQTVQLEQPQILKIKQQTNQNLNYNSAFKISSQPNSNQIFQGTKPSVTSKRTQRPANTYNVKPQSQPQQSYSPFQQITLKRQSESQEEPPVYVLKQPSNQQNSNNFFSISDKNQSSKQQTTNVFAQRLNSNTQQVKKVQNPLLNQVKKNLPYNQQTQQAKKVISPLQEQSQRNNPFKVDLQESHTIQPQMISTKTVASKSRRNKIFDNDNNNSMANTSNVMTSRSNMEGSFEKSRSKSKSKLGNLLKQSRQKKQFEKSQSLQKQKEKVKVFQNPTNNLKPSIQQSRQTDKNFFNIQKSNLISVSTLHQQSRVGGQKLGQNFLKVQQIQKKKIENNQVFDLGQSQLDLNLSMSNRIHEQTLGLKGDSVHFNFQPQKKKGISITSKQKPNTGSEHGKSIQSKKHLDRLMKKCQENQQFLAKSILSNNSQLIQSRRTNPLQGPSPQLNKRQENIGPSPKINKQKQNQTKPFQKIKQEKIEQEEPAWYNIVKGNPQFKIQNNKEEFKIKQVQRKQIKKGSQQEIVYKQAYKLQQITLMKQQKIKGDRKQKQEQMMIKPLKAAKQKITNLNEKQTVQKNQKQYVAPIVNNKNKPLLQKPKQHKINNFELQQQNRNYSLKDQYNNRYQQQNIFKNHNQSQRQNSKQISNKQDKSYQNNFPFNSNLNNQTNMNSSPKIKQEKKIIKESNLSSRGHNSTLTHQLSLSQNGSERSNSQKKNNKKKESSLNIMKKHKIQVRDQSPRAQQSFYQENHKSQQPIQSDKNYSKQSSKQGQKLVKHISQPSKAYTSEQIITESRLPMHSKMQSSQQKVQYKKPNLINFQSQGEQEQPQTIKSRTDVNFYNYNGGDMSQRSLKPPSSKPPLSRKSNCSSSKSKSKTKQGKLNINVNMKKDNKISSSSNNTSSNNYQHSQKNQNKPKKKTLLDIAQYKDYEGSAYDGSNSQCSFNSRDSRQSFGSVNSRGSRKSSGSRKQTTLPITIKQKGSTLNNMVRPPLHKIDSTNSQIQVFDNNRSIYSKLQETQQKRRSQEQKERQNVQMQQRTIVSKNTYFIDERGRLVKQDLVIQGNKVYGRPDDKSAQQMAYQRMRRSRQHHRSRSKSRDGNGNSRLSRKNSQTSFQQSGTESRNFSSNYINSQNNYYEKGSYYNSGYGLNQKPSFYIQQFIKPIQQPTSTKNQFQKSGYPNNSKSFRNPSKKIQQQFYQNQEPNCYDSYYGQQQDEQPVVEKVTLNELFGRNKKQSGNNSRSKQNNQGYYNNRAQDSRYNKNNRQDYRNNGGQQSGLMGSSVRRKSLSRTQKAFYNNR